MTNNKLSSSSDEEALSQFNSTPNSDDEALSYGINLTSRSDEPDYEVNPIEIDSYWREVSMLSTDDDIEIGSFHEDVNNTEDYDVSYRSLIRRIFSVTCV